MFHKGFSMKLADRMRQSIRRRSGHVVLRADIAPLGSASQVSQALKVLQRNGELLRLGAGVYAKARRDESSQEVTPLVDAETLAREVAGKLKARVTGAADGALVLDTGGRRVSRKLALGQNAVQYVNDRNRKTFTAFGREPSNKSTLPTTGVGSYVQSLADVHGVRYEPTAADQWAETVTRLAGDDVRSGPVQDLLIALQRAGKLSKNDMASLLVNYLRERKQRV
jgi:hypothetical protein